MSFGKKVVVAVGPEGEEKNALKELREMTFLKDSEIYFVSVFRIIDYAYGLGEYNLIFPVAQDRDKIRETILAELKKISTDFLPKDFKAMVKYDCLFHENPKEKLCEFLNEVKADLVIMTARKKRGIFESSFTQYVAKHTSADVLIIKHHQ